MDLGPESGQSQRDASRSDAQLEGPAPPGKPGQRACRDVGVREVLVDLVEAGRDAVVEA